MRNLKDYVTNSLKMRNATVGITLGEVIPDRPRLVGPEDSSKDILS